MRVEEAFGDVVRILLVIHKSMMPPMVGCPHQSRVFKRRGAKQQRQ
jgi:hypothetical protein